VGCSRSLHAAQGGQAALVHAVQQIPDAQQMKTGEQGEASLQPGYLPVAQKRTSRRDRDRRR
jgi:hypothetical protein